MICIRHIDQVVLRVIDLETMLAFYRLARAARWSGARTRSGWCSCTRAVACSTLWPSTASLAAWAAPHPGGKGRNMDHLCFRVEPFDEAAIRGHLDASGVSAGAVEVRYGAEGVGPSIYLSDPEGDVIELKGPVRAG